MKLKKEIDRFCLNTISDRYLKKWFKKFMGWGRTWGLLKDGKNPFFGTHITVIDKDQVVILVQKRSPFGYRIIDVYQFQKVKSTELGSEVIKKFYEIGHGDQLRLQ